MSSKEKNKKKETEEPTANSNEEDGTTSNPNTAETNTEEKGEDVGSDNGIVQSNEFPLTEVQEETPISNDETTPSEECNTQNNKKLIVEIQKMHFLICGKNESQTDDSIILVQKTQRVFLEMFDKIKNCVELPAQFIWDTDREKKQIANEKLAPRNDEAAYQTTRMETLHCFLDQKRGEMKKSREKEEKISIELKKEVSNEEKYDESKTLEQVHAKRTSMYQSLQESFEKQQQPTFDIPEVLPKEERQVLNKLKTDLERKAEKVKQLERDIKELDKTGVERLKSREKEMDALPKRGEPNPQAVERKMEMLIQRKDEEINDLKKHMKDQHRSGEQKLKAMEKENGELLQRLSKVAGAKLTDGNPNVTDLNDPNRPMKLAEQYKELNDNEWTNAYEILTAERGIKPKDAIKLLLDIVTDCYKECVRLAKEQWKRLSWILTKTRTENADETLKEIGFRQTEFKDLKNLRKMAATKASDGVIAKVKDVLLEKLENDEEMMQQLGPFLEESIRVTWSMAVQDPPVYMFWDLKQGDPPNDMFKVYTKGGDKVRFVVWPSLLLHEGGPLLVKGVYQLYTE